MGELWNDIKPKGKICMVLFVPLAIAFVALLVRHNLAEKGCAAAIGVWGHVANGADALVLGVFLAALAAGLFRAVIGMPEIVGSARQELAEQRERRRHMEEMGRHIPSITERYKEVACWVLIILTIVFVVLALGGGIGYIAWLLSC